MSVEPMEATGGDIPLAQPSDRAGRPERYVPIADKHNQWLPHRVKRMDGGDSRKLKRPLAVAVFIAPSHVRRATTSEECSEATSKNANLNDLTPCILRSVSYMRQGK